MKDKFLKQHNEVELWQLTTGKYAVFFKNKALEEFADRRLALCYYDRTVLEQIL